MGFAPLGRSFFLQAIKEPIKLGQGIEVWNGFYQSIRPAQSGLSLKIDMSSTAFVRAVLLIDFIVEVLNMRDLIHGINVLDYVKLLTLRGLRVEVTHRGEVHRKYHIAGLTKQSSRYLRFELSSGKTKNVRDYFRETYKLQLCYDFFFPACKLVQSRKPNYLPFEIIGKGQQGCT